MVVTLVEKGKTRKIDLDIEYKKTQKGGHSSKTKQEDFIIGAKQFCKVHGI